MALYKRRKTWWTDFSVNGQRYRQSLGTKDWREAQAREKELIAQASVGKLAPSSQQFSRLAFGEAANRYLADGCRTWRSAASRPSESACGHSSAIWVQRRSLESQRTPSGSTSPIARAPALATAR